MGVKLMPGPQGAGIGILLELKIHTVSHEDIGPDPRHGEGLE